MAACLAAAAAAATAVERLALCGDWPMTRRDDSGDRPVREGASLLDLVPRLRDRVLFSGEASTASVDSPERWAFAKFALAVDVLELLLLRPNSVVCKWPALCVRIIFGRFLHIGIVEVKDKLPSPLFCPIAPVGDAPASSLADVSSAKVPSTPASLSCRRGRSVVSFFGKRPKRRCLESCSLLQARCAAGVLLLPGSVSGGATLGGVAGGCGKRGTGGLFSSNGGSSTDLLMARRFFFLFFLVFFFLGGLPAAGVSAPVDCTFTGSIAGMFECSASLPSPTLQTVSSASDPLLFGT
mmetsp:Transcript_77659/g.154063  ORF Transcript_77659/g.154063 Transcript_77659/m.154063 type:complete len:296 (+) Transcript_77659:677-1564(+)